MKYNRYLADGSRSFRNPKYYSRNLSIFAMRQQKKPNGKPKYTLRSIGEQFGLSADQVRVIEAYGLCDVALSAAKNEINLNFSERKSVIADVIEKRL